MATQAAAPVIQENIGIPIPRETNGKKPFMLNFAEPMSNSPGLRGQTYMGTSPSPTGETGDFEND